MSPYQQYRDFTCAACKQSGRTLSRKQAGRLDYRQSQECQAEAKRSRRERGKAK